MGDPVFVDETGKSLAGEFFKITAKGRFGHAKHVGYIIQFYGFLKILLALHANKSC